MYNYFAYGLTIGSAIALPELSPSEGAPSATISVGPLVAAPVQHADDEFQFEVQGIGGLLVRRGREITVDPLPDADERVLRLSVLGPAFALLLEQRGLIALHASVAEIEGRAVAFLGESGWGKSTLTAALHARGHDVVSDDLAAIRLTEHSASVIPGFPQIKLWPHVVEHFGHDPEALPLLSPQRDKRAHRFTDGFAATEVPLARLFLLTEGEGPSVVPIAARDATVELVRHRFDLRDRRTESQARHLRHAARLANIVPARRLVRNDLLSELDTLLELVERDALDGG
jgi:hypothetical protein